MGAPVLLQSRLAFEITVLGLPWSRLASKVAAPGVLRSHLVCKIAALGMLWSPSALKIDVPVVLQCRATARATQAAVHATQAT